MIINDDNYMSFEVQLIEFISFQSGPLLSSLDTGTIEYWALPESNSLKTKWREKKKKKKKRRLQKRTQFNS